MKYRRLLLGLFISQLSFAQAPMGTVFTVVGMSNPVTAVLTTGITIYQMYELGKSGREMAQSSRGPSFASQVNQSQSDTVSTIGSIQREIDQLQNSALQSLPVRINPEDERILGNLPPTQVLAKDNRKPMIDRDAIQDPPDRDLPEFQSAGEFREQIIRQYKDLYKINPEFGKQKTARELGLNATQSADQSYVQEQYDDAQFYKDMGKEMLDIAVGLDPVTGLGRSAFELISGRNLITGGKLSIGERGFAFLGVMSGGGLPSAKNASKLLIKIVNNAPRIANEVQNIKTAIQAGKEILRPMVRLLREHNVSLKDRRDFIKAFTRDSRVTRLAEDKHVGRLYIEGENLPRGNWVTELPIVNPQELLALPRPGIYRLQHWTIPAGTEVIEGGVAPNFGLPGGGRQIFVPNPEVLQ